MDFDPLELVGGALGLSVAELLRQRLFREVNIAAPAAGAEWSTIVPAGVGWELLSVFEQFATSAVVATRTPSLVVSDPNNARALRFAPGGTQAASLTGQFCFAGGYGDHSNNGPVISPLPSPPIVIPAGWSIASATSSIDVGDQYSNIVVLVREWSVPAVQANLDWLIEALRR